MALYICLCTFCCFECNQVCIHTIVAIIIIMCVYKLFCAICCWDSFEKSRMQMQMQIQHPRSKIEKHQQNEPSQKTYSLEWQWVFLPVPLPFTGCNCLHSNLRDHLTNEDHWLCFQLNYFKNFTKTKFSSVYQKCAYNKCIRKFCSNIKLSTHTYTMLLLLMLLMLDANVEGTNCDTIQPTLSSTAQHSTATRTTQCATVFMLMSFECESGGKNK